MEAMVEMTSATEVRTTEEGLAKTPVIAFLI